MVRVSMAVRGDTSARGRRQIEAVRRRRRGLRHFASRNPHSANKELERIGNLMHPDEVESENRASEALYSIWNSRLSRKFNRQRTTETGKRHVEATRTAQPLGPQEGASRGGLSVRVCATPHPWTNPSCFFGGREELDRSQRGGNLTPAAGARERNTGAPRATTERQERAS